MACSACGSQGKLTFRQISVRDKSSLPTLKYIHCKYQDQFESLFSQIGIDGTEKNLKLLAYAYDNGSDVKGEIKDSSGNPIFFSIENILKKIDPSQITNNLCAI